MSRVAKRALITGAGGQDGSLLSELLLEHGYEVFGVVRRATSERYENLEAIRDRIELLQADLLDERSLARALRDLGRTRSTTSRRRRSSRCPGTSPSRRPSSRRSARRRCSRRSARVARRIRVYQAASSEIFGEPLEAPQHEETPIMPVTPYGAAKAYSFFIVRTYRRRYGLHASSGILYNHESPRRPLDFLPRKVANGAARDLARARAGAAARRPRRPPRLGLRRRLRPRDVADAAAGGADDYVIATGVTHAVRDLVEFAFEHVGLDWREHVRVDDSLRRARRSCTTSSGTRPRRASSSAGSHPSTCDGLVRLLVDADLERLHAAAPELVQRRRDDYVTKRFPHAHDDGVEIGDDDATATSSRRWGTTTRARVEKARSCSGRRRSGAHAVKLQKRDNRDLYTRGVQRRPTTTRTASGQRTASTARRSSSGAPSTWS